MAAAGAGAGAGADDGLIGPNDCGVCYVPIPPSEVYVLHSTTDGTEHKFHRACITDWLRTTMLTGAPFFCPVCSQSDPEVRLSRRGLLWAEHLNIILKKHFHWKINFL
jgi:hypothetical protein